MLDVLNTKTVEDLSKEYKETAEVNYPSLKDGVCVGSQLLKQVKQLY